MRIVVGLLPLKQVPVVGCFVKAIQTVVVEQQSSETRLQSLRYRSILSGLH